MTAAEVFDKFTDRVHALVESANAGRVLTEAGYAAAFERAFETAFPVFLEKLERRDPEKARAFRREFLATAA